jgi:hypothetical protein
LLGGERCVVAQHRSGSAVPGDDVPRGSLHIGRTELERVENALQSRRNVFGPMKADFGRSAELFRNLNRPHRRGAFCASAIAEAKLRWTTTSMAERWPSG